MVKKEEFLRQNGYEEKEGQVVSRTDFPSDFVFGVATSAYQIEGASNEGGRGPSIWDAFSHTEGKILDKSNGDVAVDHYHRYLVNGLGTKVNEEGITFYNNVINALLERGIQPYVTLYHWDLPLHLDESMGGWLNKKVITVEPYLAAHHQILAHAAAASIYRSKYKDKQGGQLGLVVDCEWAEANSDKIEDKTAAARRLDFQIGWFLNPLYYGEYPEVMCERLGDQLPKFSEEDKKFLLNSLDFIGLNHYTTRLISHVPECTAENHYYNVQQMERIVEWEGGQLIGEKAASEWLYVVPWGLRKIINYVSQKYPAPIYVTENGMDDEDDDSLPLHEILDDKLRVRYFKGYVASVAQAIKDGADVRGYFAWSLLDNFEWAQGYTKRFGLVYVDYKNGLTRHPKSSAYWFSRFLKDGANKKGKEE
ncbi:hypothetical protein TSUD_119700 [Trifolium subterraneum]|uniref:Beta-glucosidase n=1 Tax=Trifolium subterraneum TaxID=3900 RepID=A0A2Z6N237_TRISU|nr:hypothetical protein TSUD_119700 [Trifolium subterraneum]